ncbi:MAG: DNA primase, partial [Streptomycetales bacterium]
QVEREVLKLALQCPAILGPAFDAVEGAAFTAAPYATIRRAVAEAGGVATAAGGGAWVAQVREHAPDDAIRSLVTELAVESVRAAEAPDHHYAGALLARLQELSVTRRIAVLRSRLQRINPLEQANEHLRLFGEIVALERHRRNLGERSSASL